MGILLIGCSLIAFDLMQIFAAKTEPEIPIVEQFFRNLIGIVVSDIIVLREKISLKDIQSHVKPLLAIVYNTILALLFLHELPTSRACVGGVIVLAISVLLLWYRERCASAAC